MKEEFKIETEKERPEHEIELEERPEPQEGESLDKWLNRIGGPNVEVTDNLEKYSLPQKKEDRPLMIDSEGTIGLNEKNIVQYIGEELKKQIDDIREDNPYILFNKKTKDYQIKKEQFREPEKYLGIIVDLLRENKKLVVDKRFEKSVENWEKELEKEVKEEEKPEAEKAMTLDEQIEQKRKEIEEIEIGYNIYYSPVVQDLLGLYYKERFGELKSLKKELGELERGGKKPDERLEPEEAPEKGPEPPEELPVEKTEETIETEEIPEKKRFSRIRGYFERRKAKKETLENYFNHLKYTDNLFNEMVERRKAAKEKGIDPSTRKIREVAYKIKKKEWGDAYEKTGELFDSFGKKTKEKIMKKKEESLLRKAWKDFWELFTKKAGKETIEEVKKDAIEEQLKVIKKRLKGIPKEIREIGVLGRADLEKEEKRLEKKFKQLDKKLKK